MASQLLKDVIFSLGMTQNCSSAVHSNRLVNAVSEFLAFYPLDYEHIKQVCPAVLPPCYRAQRG